MTISITSCSFARGFPLQLPEITSAKF